MQNRMPDMTPVCTECGKQAPIDAKMSNSNWMVYKTKEPCSCGGAYKSRFLIEVALSERGGEDG